MITKTLFQSSKMQIHVHPQYVKPKHKSYRQLLGLDRPKKKIQVESDNQNDDFLEKLLREQAKQKKKKHDLKKKLSKSRVKESRQKEKSKDKQRDKKNNKNTIGSVQLKNDNNNVIFIQKSSDIIKSVEQTAKSKAQTQLKTNKDSRNNIKNRKQNNVQTALKYKQSKIKSDLNNKTNQNDNIKIDDQASIPYIVNNSLPTPLNTVRSSLGMNILAQLHKSKKQQSSHSISIKHKLNPEQHNIFHEIKYESRYPKFEANVLSTKKLLAMTDGWEQFSRSQRKLPIRQTLFKNSAQEQRFVKNLQTMRTSKKSMPSFL